MCLRAPARPPPASRPRIPTATDRPSSTEGRQPQEHDRPFTPRRSPRALPAQHRPARPPLPPRFTSRYTRGRDSQAVAPRFVRPAPTPGANGVSRWTKKKGAGDPCPSPARGRETTPKRTVAGGSQHQPPPRNDLEQPKSLQSQSSAPRCLCNPGCQISPGNAARGILSRGERHGRTVSAVCLGSAVCLVLSARREDPQTEKPPTPAECRRRRSRWVTPPGGPVVGDGEVAVDPEWRAAGGLARFGETGRKQGELGKVLSHLENVTSQRNGAGILDFFDPRPPGDRRQAARRREQLRSRGPVGYPPGPPVGWSTAAPARRCSSAG